MLDKLSLHPRHTHVDRALCISFPVFLTRKLRQWLVSNLAHVKIKIEDDVDLHVTLVLLEFQEYI